MNEILNISFSDVDTVEPIALQIAKDWLRVSGSDDDDIISSLITAAREAVEGYTSCSLVSKTVECTACIKELFELPHGPVVGDVVVTCNDEVYTGFLEVAGDFKKVYGSKGTFSFEYEVGYNPVPEALKQAILNEVAYRYTNRGDQVKGLTIGSNYLCEAAVFLCQPYKRMIWL